MSDHWTAWIDHDGNGLPDRVRGQWIQVVGETPDGEAIHSEVPNAGRIPEIWDWSLFGKIISVPGHGNVRAGRILRYRLRRYPTAESLIETIRTVKQGEDA